GHVFPVAHVATPDLPVLVQDCRVNPSVLLVAVLVLRRHVPILASLPRRPPLVASAPAQRLGDQLIPLIGEERLDILHHESAGEAALLLFDTDYPLDAVDPVAGPDWPEELPVIAGVKAVHARQAPTGAARPAKGVGEAGMAELGAPAGVATVLDVAIEGIQVADTVAEVGQGVGRRVVEIWAFRAQLHAVHLLEPSDALVGDRALCRALLQRDIICRHRITSL